jgi:hypothetical protein
MTDTDTDTIETLQAEVDRLKDELSIASSKLKDAQVKAAPFQVGDEALNNGNLVIIREVEPKPWGTYWYKVSKQKKNGEWSKAVATAYGKLEPKP